MRDTVLAQIHGLQLSIGQAVLCQDDSKEHTDSMVSNLVLSTFLLASIVSKEVKIIPIIEYCKEAWLAGKTVSTKTTFGWRPRTPHEMALLQYSTLVDFVLHA